MIIIVLYCSHLLKVSQEVVLPGVRTLLQHLCVKVPERSEYRAKVGQVRQPCTLSMIFCRLLTSLFHDTWIFLKISVGCSPFSFVSGS